MSVFFLICFWCFFREDLASFFDPCINIVLKGLRKRIENLVLDANVRLFVIRERRH